MSMSVHKTIIGAMQQHLQEANLVESGVVLLHRLACSDRSHQRLVLQAGGKLVIEAALRVQLHTIKNKEGWRRALASFGNLQVKLDVDVEVDGVAESMQQLNLHDGMALRYIIEYRFALNYRMLV
jgi:hypothetical protein